MRKFIIPAIVLSATMVAAPAAAQSWGQQRHNQHNYQQGRNIEQQLRNLVDRIRRAEQRDLISNREADRLMRQVANIDQRYDRYRRNGLSYQEQQDLQYRIQAVRQRIQSERREGRYEDRRRDRW